MSGQPLLVIGLGGNALSPPTGDLSPTAERTVVARTMAEVADLAAEHRLLIVHGNGPQIGRLLAADPAGDDGCLDILVSQTQGELGYLLCESLDRALGTVSSIALVTRVLIDPDDPAFSRPDKPIGRVTTQPGRGPWLPTPDGRGWRRVVASPRPIAVLELEAIRASLSTHHVVAGGGGGVPLTGRGSDRLPCAAVVDKDRVAALLAIELGAARLVFVTDVPHAFDDFAGPSPRPIPRMSVASACDRLASGVFAAGSMGPKVESAVDFVSTTRRPAVITTAGAVRAALAGTAGTTIH